MGPEGSGKSNKSGNTWNRLRDDDKQRIKDGRGIKFTYSIWDRTEYDKYKEGGKGWTNTLSITSSFKNDSVSDKISAPGSAKPQGSDGPQRHDGRAFIHSEKDLDFDISGRSVAQIQTVSCSIHRGGGNNCFGGLTGFVYDNSSETLFVF